MTSPAAAAVVQTASAGAAAASAPSGRASTARVDPGSPWGWAVSPGACDPPPHAPESVG